MKFKQLMAVAGIVLAAGCSSVPPVEKNYSGYLGDYSQLKAVEVADGSDVRRWVKSDIQKGKYKKIVVQPVTFFPAPRTSNQVRLEALHKISNYMTERVRQELSKYFEITDVAGADTVNMQVAITGVSTPLEGLKYYEVIPLASIYAGATAIMGARDKVTVIYVEGIVTDSVTGEELAKGLRQGVGESLRDSKEQLDVEKVKLLLDNWAKDVGQFGQNVL